MVAAAFTFTGARRALWLAWLAHTFGDTRAVEIWCHEGNRLDPDSPEPHLMLGLVMMRGERWAEAVEEFEAALNKPGVALERRALLETYRADALANEGMAPFKPKRGRPEARLPARRWM